jgi:catechol 2,3-dioxygenase-like lactoylglutathione lyase family enzyme
VRNDAQQSFRQERYMRNHRHGGGGDGHADLHSELGPNRGEHSGRSVNPTIKVADLAWLEFEKPDLARAETFARAFGFAVATREPSALYLRGSLPGTPCLVIRKGAHSRFVGPTFKAGEASDLHRLARATDRRVEPLTEPTAASIVRLTDPSGFAVGVVHVNGEFPALAGQQTHILNFGAEPRRINATQRPPRAPALVQRLGHLVLQTPQFSRALDWYLDTLGMIVSDFQYALGQRERGPALAFIRCDRGTVPADHHTLALNLGPTAGYSHSAYQVTDLDAVAAGGEYLLQRGYHRAWGIGRHVLGSQIFDYWHDPDKLPFEHFTDGDLFDNTIEPGWSPLTASGLSQWGPRVTQEFLGAKPSLRLVRDVVAGLRGDNEITLSRLSGMAIGLRQ